MSRYMYSTVGPLRAENQHAIGKVLLSQTRASQRVRYACGAVLAIGGLTALRIPIAYLFPPQVLIKDFLQPYLLGRAIQEGTNPYLPIPTLAERYVGAFPPGVFPHPTPHPPPIGILLLPLSYLDYQLAAIVWFAFEIIFITVSAYLLALTQRIRLSPILLCMLTGMLLLWSPFPADLFWGQLVSLQLLLLVAMRLAIQAKRPILSGVLLAVAILVKPTPWPLLIVFIFRREWRLLLAAIATVAFGYLACSWIMGFVRLFDYFSTAIPAATQVYRAFWDNWSTWTIGWRLLDGTGSPALADIFISISAPPLIKYPQAAGVVSALITALVLVIGVIQMHKQESLDVALGIMLCVALLISPVSWTHYFQLLCLPLARIVGQLHQQHFPRKETNLALAVGMLLFVALDGFWKILSVVASGQQFSPDVTEYHLSFAAALLTLGPGLGVVALGWLLIRFGRRQPTTTTVQA